MARNSPLAGENTWRNPSALGLGDIRGLGCGRDPVGGVGGLCLREEKERVIAHCNTPEPGPGRGHRVGAAGDPEWGSCWGSTLRPGRWSPVGSLAGRERCCSACRQRGGEFHTRRAAGCCWGCAGRTGFPPRLLAGETLESGSWSDWPGLRAGPLLRARGAGAGARRWLKTHRNSWEKHQTPRAGSALPASQGLAKGAAQPRVRPRGY